MSLSNLEKLIEKTSPVCGEFTITIGKGDCQVEFVFELPNSFGTWVRFKEEQTSWALEMSRLKMPPDPLLKDHWVSDRPSLEAVYFLTSLSREPAKVTLLDALKMLKAPSLVEGLIAQVEARRAIIINETLQEVESAKNE